MWYLLLFAVFWRFEMRIARFRVVILSILCIVLAPFAVAKEIMVAKVYRDYPGYIGKPACDNPRLSPDYAKQPAVREKTSDMVAAEDSVSSYTARKVYRNYPGYMYEMKDS